MYRRFLSQLVRTEYITVPLLNFLSQSLKDSQDAFQSFVVRNPGILTERLTEDTYVDALMVYLNQQTRQVSVGTGAFINSEGIITNISETIYPFQIQLSDFGKNLEVCIRQFDTQYNPGTLTLNANSTQVIGTGTNFMEFLEPGMSIEIASEDSAQNARVYEVTGVNGADSITISPAPVASESGIPFKVNARFFGGVVVDDAVKHPYTFSKYIVSYYERGAARHPDDVLLAYLEFNQETSIYTVRNIRGTEEDNIAKIFSGLSDSVERSLFQFFVDGILKIGDGEEKDIYTNSHVQNTDIGTDSLSFAIGLQQINQIKLETVQSATEYVISLLNDESVSRKVLLPTSEEAVKDEDGNVSLRLASLDKAQQFKGLQALYPHLAEYTIVSGTLTLDKTANIFSAVSDGQALSRIEINNAKSGSIIFIRASSAFTVNPSSNTNIVAPEMQLLSGDIISFMYMGNSWVLVSAGLFDSRLVVEVKSIVDELNALFIEYDVPALIAAVQENTEIISDLAQKYDTMYSTYATRISSIEASLSSLTEKVDSLTGFVPKGVIFAINITEGELRNYFDKTGKGKNGTIYSGYQICNGSGGSPNMSGRILIMANSSTYLELSGSSSTDSVSSSANTTQNGRRYPAYDLAVKQKGSFAPMLIASQMPKHTHASDPSGGGRGAAGFYSLTPGGSGEGKRSCGQASGSALMYNTGVAGGSTGYDVLPMTYTIIYIMKL